MGWAGTAWLESANTLFEPLLAGLRSAHADDDALLAEAAKIFDLLLLNCQEKNDE